MLFNSLAYAVFLPLAVLVYFLLPQRWRWAALLGFSYYFYMSWNPELIVLILDVYKRQGQMPFKNVSERCCGNCLSF